MSPPKSSKIGFVFYFFNGALAFFAALRESSPYKILTMVVSLSSPENYSASLTQVPRRQIVPRERWMIAEAHVLRPISTASVDDEPLRLAQDPRYRQLSAR